EQGRKQYPLGLLQGGIGWPDARIVLTQPMHVRDVPATPRPGSDAALEYGRSMAVEHPAVLQKDTVLLECNLCMARMPRELEDCLALREVPHERGDLRRAGGLTLPGQKEPVVLPGIVLEAVFPVHAESRLEGRERRSVVRQPMQGHTNVELHDDHRAV